jgi:hypothetical protein
LPKQEITSKPAFAPYEDNNGRDRAERKKKEKEVGIFKKEKALEK